MDISLSLCGGVVIDGSGREPTRADLLVVNERIERMGDGLPASSEVLDVDGLTLLPGLIDAHSHFGLVEVGHSTTAAAVTAARIFRNCELALDGGFTTVRDTGGIDGGVATAVELGLIRGPRIFPSGPLLSQTGGHGDHADPFDHRPASDVEGLPGLTQLGIVCDGPDEVRLAARRVLRRGAAQVKVCISGGVVSLTDRIEDTQFTVDELVAAVQEADARGTYVTAHAHNSRGIQIGLEAGVQCFEHGTFLDEDTAISMARAGAYLVPTFSVTRVFADKAPEWGIPPSMVARMNGVEEAMARSLRIAREAGVLIGSGSDILGPEQTQRGLELMIRSQLGDAMEAIVSATSNNARVLRRENDLGTLEVGKLADIIAIDFNPLEAPEEFQDPAHVRLVLKGGNIVKDTR